MIIQIAKNEWQFRKKFVHEALKGLSGVFESKRHEDILKKSEWGDDGSFRNVRFRQWYLMITLHQVQFGEEFAAAEFDGKVLDVWQWVPVWGGDVVEPSVVTTWPECTILLWYQVKW